MENKITFIWMIEIFSLDSVLEYFLVIECLEHWDLNMCISLIVSSNICS